MTTTLDSIRLLRARETAELLGISPRQLDYLQKRGVVKPIRLTKGGQRRFRVSDLAALVGANEED